MYKKLWVLIFAFLVISFNGYAQTGNDRVPPEDRINECIAFIPNAFTPNGDGINDRFGVKVNPNCLMISFNIKIFDRWGRMIFDADDYREPYWWDGTFDGNRMKDGVYVYNIIAEFELPDRSERVEIRRQGFFTLIR